MINNINLEICCFSTYDLLINKMEEIVKVEDGHNFHFYDDLKEFFITMGDIFIFDAAMDLQEVSTIVGEKKKHRITFLVGDISEIATMEKELLTQFDQIIFKEHIDILLEQRIKYAVDVAREKMDLYLTENYLNTLIDGLPDLVWVKNAKGAHLKVNNSFCRAVGKTKEQIFYRGHNYIWDLTEAEYEQGEYICLESEDETINRRQTCTFNEIVKTKAGLRNFQTDKIPIFHTETGVVIGTVGIARDVTDVNNVINQQNEFFNSIPIGLVVCNEENKIINSNKRAAEIFGISTLDLCNLEYEELRSKYFSKIEVGRKENHEEVEIGSVENTHIYEVATGEIKDIFKNSRGHYYIFHEVTAERQYQKQLFRHASTDSLTGLLNRKYFYNEIDEERIYPDCN
ncbi:MAG: PAS domain S-box protein, partial [Anaerotignaceae bacterium]